MSGEAEAGEWAGAQGAAGREGDLGSVQPRGPGSLLFQTKRPESLDTARGMYLYEEVGRTAGPSEDWGGRSGVAQAEVCQAGIDVGWTGVQAQAGLEKPRPSRSAAL